MKSSFIVYYVNMNMTDLCLSCINIHNNNNNVIDVCLRLHNSNEN